MSNPVNKRHIRYSHFFLIVGALFIINCVLLTIFLTTTPVQPVATKAISYPELKNPKLASMNFKQLVTYFQLLAKKKGALYAYQILLRAPIKPDTDLHLLAHAVGDILYQQQGARGIQSCTQDFRNACSHAIVINLFQEKGEKALGEIAKLCEEAPGYGTAYTMCFHGLGHGVFAYYDYDFPKATATCKKLGTARHNYRESVECIGGAVMEIISGGGHDKIVWDIQRKQYLHPNDPLSLCRSDFIPVEAKSICYIYLTPYLYEAVGKSQITDDKASTQQAFAFCNQIEDTNDRLACYGGFGKEFEVLVQNRDIRTQVQLGNSQMKKLYELCSLAPGTQAIDTCISYANNSIYWGGEHSETEPIRFCSVIADGSHKDTCYTGVMSMIHSYNRNDTAYLEKFCKQLPHSYQTKCVRQLL